jgi:phage recombination protein Bet
MSDLAKFENLLLKGDDVKRSFAANYVAQLFKSYSCDQSDIIQFLHQAQISGANPVLKEIYLIERNTKVKGEHGQDKWVKRGTVVYSYNFLLRVAAQTGQFDGYTEKFEVEKVFDPLTRKPGLEELVCTVTVKRKGHGEYPYSARWSEYSQDNTQWKSKPYVMLGKCALSGALRRAFPEAMGGVFLEEEFREEDLDRENQIKANQDAIEVKAEVRAEKEQVLSEKIEQEDERTKTLELIKERMGKLTTGQTPTEKGKALKDVCGVLKFDDLNSKTLVELKEIAAKALSLMEEKILQSAQKKKSAADNSFKLENP